MDAVLQMILEVGEALLLVVILAALLEWPQIISFAGVSVWLCWCWIVSAMLPLGKRHVT